MRIMCLIQAVFRKELALTVRYVWNSLIGVISMVALFVFLFLGYTGLTSGSPDYATGLAHLLTGYILTISALFFYQDIAQNLSTEASEGVLEMLSMSPYGYSRVGAARLCINSIWNLLMIAAISLLLIRITGRPFDADIGLLLPLMLLFLVPAIGISFALGGLQLLFKKLDSLMGLLQFLVAAFVAMPIDGAFFFARALPGVLPAHLSRSIAAGLFTRETLPADLVIQAVLVSVLWLIAGITLFYWAERRAKRDGHLAHY